LILRRQSPKIRAHVLLSLPVKAAVAAEVEEASTETADPWAIQCKCQVYFDKMKNI
jgi:hypothetical protein